jgi:hypothetical protein
MSARTIQLLIVDPEKPSVDELIDREIAGHGTNWCSSDCRTFLPSIYRAFRMCGCSPASMQEIHSSCHAMVAENDPDQIP